jgi:hypothetical protein
MKDDWVSEDVSPSAWVFWAELDTFVLIKVSSCYSESYSGMISA